MNFLWVQMVKISRCSFSLDGWMPAHSGIHFHRQLEDQLRVLSKSVCARLSPAPPATFEILANKERAGLISTAILLNSRNSRGLYCNHLPLGASVHLLLRRFCVSEDHPQATSWLRMLHLGIPTLALPSSG